MDFSTLGPLATSLGKAGLPVLKDILTAAATSVGGPLGALVPPLVQIIAEALGLPKDAAPETIQATVDASPSAAQSKLAQIQADREDWLKWATLQTDQNALEAKNPDLFVSGWRPFFAWTCIFWTSVALGWTITGHELPAAFLNVWNAVWVAFGGMLGLRSVEKWLGVASVSLKTVVATKTKK